MTAFDWVIVAFAAFAAVGGYRLGLVARAASWLGLAVGLALSIRLVHPAVSLVEGSDELVRLLVATSVVIGLALIGQAIGFSVGARLRVNLPRGAVRRIDAAGGAVAGVLGVLVVVWLMLPTFGLFPGAVARAARQSTIVGWVDDVAPEPPAALRDLSKRVSDFDFPEVFSALTPAPEVGPPPTELPVPAAVVEQVSASTVNVEARGCGRIQEGSGFVIAPDLVATNAHVVAGTGSISVLLTDGSRRDGTVVAFDDNRDLALISTPGIGRTPLAIHDAEVGEGAAVFGHPNGQDQLRVAPATVGDQIEAVGRDIYNQDRVRRQVLVLASNLAHGDSGAAVVDAQGAAIGIAFAIAPDRPGTAYALDAPELRAVLAAPHGSPVSTGSCL